VFPGLAIAVLEVFGENNNLHLYPFRTRNVVLAPEPPPE
jgi:hypothetical protein